MATRETFPTFGDKKRKALDAYKKFVSQGVTTPDALDLNDPDVIEATRLFNEWDLEQTERQDPRRHNFEKTKFYVDAGFTDPHYLAEVLQWLSLDSDDLGKDDNDPALVQLRQDYADEIRKIRKKLSQEDN
ncbi:MAG: hypothetical protein A2941_01440 [Candidatus Yanofskybacteria bacterium RIFCSPLOWO2_01_FULL_49_17]|uniref:Uncharacterized protein n=1 Tax=Candidatus Yanofskybacteria bacterium RIFCSPLOWO2_01_FULL_49_17 TaxID=1802700 RepID=A0A1F8GQE1_9BACT|nr:MAG: hypothetical protein A2941_01440 [Candidatus Yanofskybacteria bacterium RIFCSPLOWO2_01_FULL_49_17]